MIFLYFLSIRICSFSGDSRGMPKRKLWKPSILWRCAKVSFSIVWSESLRLVPVRSGTVAISVVVILMSCSETCYKSKDDVELS
jgi:hypothetical protein